MPFGLDVQLLLRTGLVLALDDLRRGGPRRFHVAAGDEIRLEQVVLPPDRRGARQRVVYGEDRRQRLDVDPHAAARLFEQVAIGVGEENDRLFGMIDGPVRRDRADRR